MDTLDKEIEAQVRREFRAKFRARMLLLFHLLLYSLPVFVLISALASPSINLESWIFLVWLVWTPILLYHISHYYFNHDKGRENREAQIQAEVQRRKMLTTDEAKFKNNDADYDGYALTHDGELFEYAEDELKRKHQA